MRRCHIVDQTTKPAPDNPAAATIATISAIAPVWGPAAVRNRDKGPLRVGFLPYAVPAGTEAPESGVPLPPSAPPP